MVIDVGVVIFHLFREEARDFYDLDGLWGDAPLLEMDLQ
jgi:ribosome-associated protein